MTRHKKNVKYFRIYPESSEAKDKLKLYRYLISGSSAGSFEDTDLEKNFVDRYFLSCSEKGLFKKNNNEDKGAVILNGNAGSFLGIGIREGKGSICVMDLCGVIGERTEFPVRFSSGFKGRKKDIDNILEDIENGCDFQMPDLLSSGFAVPMDFNEKNPKSAILLAEGLSRIFASEVFIINETVAAGYSEVFCKGCADSKGILYVHTDIGSGAVFKDEMIFEADETSTGREKNYLRHWSQFGIVAAAKELVKKGFGTSIVEKTGGDVDAIDLDTVMASAEEGDELAIELVKRSSYALGIRVSYLVNMFDVETVILGGGIEKTKGGFKNYIKESIVKFVSEKKAGKLEIISGEKGDLASSTGAALLSRRELFMEV